jgi:carboxynorspermidine decarboxylase
MAALDPQTVPTSPAYVIDLAALEANLQVLADVQARAGAKILLAFKGFAAHATFPLVQRYLAGAAVSSPHEAELAGEYGFPEIHAYAPAYSRRDMDEILRHAGHVNFNSANQVRAFGDLARAAGAEIGLRVNPEHSEVDTDLYNPCAPGSRLGALRSQVDDDLLRSLDGLHFHTLCELGADALERTLGPFVERFGDVLAGRRWVNFGGGHHITRDEYDRDLLVRLVRDFRTAHGVEVYLEPGEAIAIGTGVLVATVLDIVHNGVDIAILDASATAHMPDTLEMPYRPHIEGAGLPLEKAHTYRLGGLTCLSGDVIGDYSFDAPLKVGDRVVFADMAHYTMVKTSNFNGVRLPAIVLRETDGTLRTVREFGYDSYRDRLS